MGRAKENLVAEAMTLSPAARDRAASIPNSSSPGVAVAPNGDARGGVRLPVPLQFPLVIVLTFSLSSLANSILRSWTDGEVGTIARWPEPTSEIALLAAWKLLELGFCWFGDYDAYDLAALSLLSHGPYLYLLSAFYGLSTRATGAYLGIEVLSSFIPFLLLRRLSGAHSAAADVPNREIIQDMTLLGFTTLLAGTVYSTTLFLACRLYLPSIFVLYFEGIPSVLPAVDATLVGSVPTETLCLLFGSAARVFIFTPAAAARSSQEDPEAAAFNPETATLQETLLWNLWGYTAESKVAIRRTAMAAFFTGIRTFLQCQSLQGVEPFGAAVYAAVWVAGTLLTGQSLVYVQAV